MLARLFLAVVVVSVVCASETKDDDLNFFPKWLVESTKEPSDSDTWIIGNRKPAVTGIVKGGTVCLNTDECGRGKCCLRRAKSPRRRCRRLQRAEERCTEEQMMGGYYYGFCPCNKYSVCRYINGTQKCVKKEKRPPQRPALVTPLTTGLPPTNATYNETESQESEELLATPKLPPSKRPAFNLSGNHFPDIPEFFRGTMPSPFPRPTTPAPVPAPGTPPPVPGGGVVAPAPPVGAGPVSSGGGAGIPGAGPMPSLPPDLAPSPGREKEGLPGSGSIPALPPPPVMLPLPSPAKDVEGGLPGQGDVPPLPPPPMLLDANSAGAHLRRSSRSARPPTGVQVEEQSPFEAQATASTFAPPPFDFQAVDGTQKRIL